MTNFKLRASVFKIFTYRGPPDGSRGNVVLLFDNNRFSKIGVRFDKRIPDGVDLGGACEAGHGFFCNGNNPFSKFGLNWF